MVGDCNGPEKDVEEAADPVLVKAGQVVFEGNCAACHQQQTTPVAPGLSGILGRKAAVEDFPYSPAFRKAGFTWDEDSLNRYLETPRAVVPDNQMAFFGLENPSDRTALIAYLKTY